MSAETTLVQEGDLWVISIPGGYKIAAIFHYGAFHPLTNVTWKLEQVGLVARCQTPKQCGEETVR